MDNNRFSMFDGFNDYSNNGLKKQLFSNVASDGNPGYSADPYNADVNPNNPSEPSGFMTEKSSKLWNHINSRSYVIDNSPNVNESNQVLNDPNRIFNLSRIKIDEDQDKIEVISDVFSEQDDVLNRLSMNRPSNISFNAFNNRNINAVTPTATSAPKNVVNTTATPTMGINSVGSNRSSTVGVVNEVEANYVQEQFVNDSQYPDPALNQVEPAFLDASYIPEDYMESNVDINYMADEPIRNTHPDLNSMTPSDVVKQPPMNLFNVLNSNINTPNTATSAVGSSMYPPAATMQMNILEKINSVEQPGNIDMLNAEVVNKLASIELIHSVEGSTNISADNNPFESRIVGTINRNNLPFNRQVPPNQPQPSQFGDSTMTSHSSYTNAFNTPMATDGFNRANMGNFGRSVPDQDHSTYTRPISMAANVAGYGSFNAFSGAYPNDMISYTSYVDYNPFSVFSNIASSGNSAGITDSDLRKLKSIFLNNTHSEETMVKYFTEAICITNSQMMAQLIKFLVSLISENHKVRQFVVRLLLCALSFHPEEFVGAFKVEYLSVLFTPQIDDTIGVHFLKLLLSYKSTFHSTTEVSNIVPISVNPDGYLVYPTLDTPSSSAGAKGNADMSHRALDSGRAASVGQHPYGNGLDFDGSLDDFKDGKIETLFLLKILTDRNKVTSVYDLYNSILREQLCMIWYEMPNTIPNVNIIEILLHWINSKEDLDTKKYPFLLLEKIMDLNQYPRGNILLLSQFFLFAIKHKANIHHHLEFLITLVSSQGVNDVLAGALGNRLIGIPNQPGNAHHGNQRTHSRAGSTRHGTNRFDNMYPDQVDVANENVLPEILYQILYTFNEKDLLDLWCLLCVIPWKVTSPNSPFSNLFSTTLVTILKVTSSFPPTSPGYPSMGYNNFDAYSERRFNTGYESNRASYKNGYGYDNHRDPGYMGNSAGYPNAFREDGKFRLDILENCLRIALVRCSCPVNSLNTLLQITLLLNPNCAEASGADITGKASNLIITCLKKNGMILNSLCTFLWKCHFLWTRIKEGVNIEVVIVVTELYKILSNYTNTKPLDNNHEYNFDSNKMYNFFQSYSGNGLWTKISNFIPQMNLDHYMEHIGHASMYGDHIGIRGPNRSGFPFTDRPQDGYQSSSQFYGPSDPNLAGFDNWRDNDSSYPPRDNYHSAAHKLVSSRVNKLEYGSVRGSDRTTTMGHQIIGLKNLGNSCYMNSLLQSLYHTRLFVHNLLLIHNNPNALRKLNNSSREDVNGNKYEERTPMLNAVANLFNKMRSTHKKSVSPKNIFRIFSDNLSKSQQDVTEAIRFISEALDPNLELWKSVFAGLVVRRIKCLRCESISDNEETMYDFSLTLHKAKTVQQMIDNFSAVETLSGENKYFCLVCNKDVRAKMWNEIASPPSHLIIILNRNLWSSNETHKLLKRIKINSELVITGFQYKLYGSIIHVGDSTDSGHYYYIGCDSEAPSDWHKIDDSSITKLNEFAIDEISRESNTHVPYVLYYRCIQAPLTPLD